MFLKSLNLLNFKCFSEQEFELAEGVNGFVGNNGVGKTNILDAIHYLSVGKSYLNSVDKQIVRFNEDFFVVSGEWMLEKDAFQVHCSFKTGAKKKIRCNKKEYEKLSEHVGKFPVVFISPYDGDLIAEGSEMRRKWFDGILAQSDKTYLELIQRYQRIIEQRNSLLKQFFENRMFDKETIDVWDVQMTEIGQKIFEARTNFLSDFLPDFTKIYAEIAGNSETVHIAYKSHFQSDDFYQLLKDGAKKDALTQYSNFGVHKDDLLFTIKGHPVKKFGSQGQQKTFLISLRIAQYDWMKRQMKKKPVLLLDDIFDKLDNLRVKKLVALVASHYLGQVIITDTDPQRMEQLFDQIEGSKKLFHLANAEHEPIKMLP
jgi:DNA replication and repair protein RecF